MREGDNLWFLTFDTGHAFECIVQSIGSGLQAVLDSIVLLRIQLITGLSLLGRVGHQFDQTLPNNRWAKHDANIFVDLRLNFRVKIDKLKISTTVTALANHSLGNTMQRGQLDFVVFTGELLLQLSQSLFERCKFANEHVGLVDFVCQNDQVFLYGKVNHVLDVVRTQTCACRVTGVDDDNGANIDAVAFGDCD